MIKEETIQITPTMRSRLDQVDFSNLVFGREFSDHMFIMDYADGAWQTPQILPYQNLSMSPASSVLHYGQSIFEGMKAFRTTENRAGLFRPSMNIQRMNRSAERMCMPLLDEGLFMEALTELIKIDRNWIPTGEGESLYIRPVMFATDEYVGVKPGENYRFLIFTSPVNAYYAAPVKVKIETHYTRSVKGGTGYAKTAGNYAASLYPAKKARQAGFDQLVWTDALEHKYIEESGTMNIMFILDGKLITPALGDTILAGITRDSVLHIARDWGLQVEERKVSIQEVLDGLRSGTLTEAFGAGTAATIAHIASVGFEDEVYELPPIEQREFSTKVGEHLRGIRRFRVEDKYNWMVEL